MSEREREAEREDVRSCSGALECGSESGLGKALEHTTAMHLEMKSVRERGSARERTTATESVNARESMTDKLCVTRRRVRT